MKTTYKKFLAHPIDLSPLGIERGADACEPCYCTPIGYNMIGSAGVDGIHFCFVRGYGETVFAVNPSNLPGEQVHPIARDFGDLLDLLVSTSHIAAIEQAWMWTKDEFYAFLAENLPTPERESAMRRLETELGATFIEEPYDYIRKLRCEFDMSKLKFPAEYYESLEAADEPEREWAVYFDGGFDCRKVGRASPCKELALGCTFAWSGETWHVPAIYVGSKGLVVELFSESDRDFDFRATLITGKPLVNYSCQYAYYSPETADSSDRLIRDARRVIEHYSLDPTKSWTLRRLSFATERKIGKLRSLMLRLDRLPEEIELARLENPQVGTSAVFTHPLTGIEHTLTVTSLEQSKHDSSESSGFEIPTHHTLLTYKLEPDISGLEFSLRDIDSGDSPRKLVKPIEAARIEARTSSDRAVRCDDFASAIAIIGGVSGPAVGLTTEGRAAVSSLYFEPKESITWRAAVRVKTVKDTLQKLI